MAPPLGLLYLASVLERLGDSVSIGDFTAEAYSMEALRRSIHGADVVGMTVLSPSLSASVELANEVKDIDPSRPLVVGGPHATLFPEETLEAIPADFCVQGDGEAAVQTLREVLDGRPMPPALQGIWQRRHGTITAGLPPQPCTDMGGLPLPARHLVRHYRYGTSFDPRIAAGQFTSILTSRGCPFSCRFCSRSSLGFHRYRVRTVESILAELESIVQQGYRHCAIMDDCFPPAPARAHALFDAILDHDLPLTLYVSGARVDSLDRTLYTKMRQAGVASMQFGLESGVQEILDFYDKRTTVSQIEAAVRLSHEVGFVTIGSFIFGAPTETFTQMQQTVAFAKRLPLDSTTFLPLRYMGGSELWDNARAEGKIASDEYVVTADALRGLALYPAEELVRFCQQAQRSFYLRPRYVASLLSGTLQRRNAAFLRSFLATTLGWGRPS